MIKQHSFISVVVYSYEGEGRASFFAELARELDAEFEHAELVIVCDGQSCCDSFFGELQALPLAVTVINMGTAQGLEASMNAGVDASVGDFILEIDDMTSFDMSFIAASMRQASEGHDIVFGEADNKSLKGRLFYPLFNRFSGFSTDITTGQCRLVSRRALNRVRSMSAFSTYRKAAYAASGLSVIGIPQGNVSRADRNADLDLAIDSLALYTNFFFRLSVGLAISMALVSFGELMYVIAILLGGHAIAGWTTTMFTLTFGFLGVFVILAFAIKYLDILTKATFNKQNYLVESIEKAR